MDMNVYNLKKKGKKEEKAAKKSNKAAKKDNKK